MTKVCILGLGLIGGSLLRDLQDKGVEVFGYNRTPSSVETAREEGYDVSSDLVDTLTRAETEGAFIVIATPMDSLAGLLETVHTHAPHCGFTDVVSVKGAVWRLVEKFGMQATYVGSHPMAGTADSGWSATQTGLFQDAAWVVTYDYAASFDDVTAIPAAWIDHFKTVVHLADTVGAEVVPARADNHDMAVAKISHLPHVLAETLAIEGDRGGALTLSLAAGSYRDGTRVAGSSVNLVRNMLENNATALVESLDQALEILHQVRDDLAAPDPSVGEFVGAGYTARVRFDARHGMRPVIRVNVGQDGWGGQLEQAEALGARILLF
ncbi:MAG: prephenate dehydrogenase [Corynebacterium sp.]|nr:prephenate dehydrogenase [Corynebacterium sp.]